MKKLILIFSFFLLPLSSLLFPFPTHAQETTSSEERPGYINYLSGSIAIQLTGAEGDQFKELSADAPMSIAPYLAGRLDKNGKKGGLLPTGGRVIANLFKTQPSSREYIADILENIGVPTVSRAYAQGTGYKAMSPFLPFWKVFRNLAYSLYIIMFVVVGIMIMLRTKVSAQAVITIQAALPNLLITLLLITFSYAIVGFMIDLMYFLIYFVVYLISSAGIIQTPLKAIDRLLSYSAYSIIFEGRNSIVSGVSEAIDSVLAGLGTGALEVAGTILSWVDFAYLVVAVYLLIKMFTLMIALLKAYVMLIVQLITAPLQILMNALPGSKAFSSWLKKTASYLIPFPVAAAMFIFSAVLIGDPTKATLFNDGFYKGSANPFGIDQSHEFYSTSENSLWMPPFTLTGDIDFNTRDVMIIVGFMIFCMTPSVVKMAQEWLQVKESPYAAEALQGFMGIAQVPTGWIGGQIKQGQSMHEQRKLQDYAAGRFAEKMGPRREETAGKQSD